MKCKYFVKFYLLHEHYSMHGRWSSAVMYGCLSTRLPKDTPPGTLGSSSGKYAAGPGDRVLAAITFRPPIVY